MEVCAVIIIFAIVCFYYTLNMAHQRSLHSFYICCTESTDFRAISTSANLEFADEKQIKIVYALEF